MKKTDLYFLLGVILPSSISLIFDTYLLWLPFFFICLFTTYENIFNNKSSFDIKLFFIGSFLLTINFFINFITGRYLFFTEILIIIMSASYGLYFVKNPVSLKLQELNLFFIFIIEIFLRFTGNSLSDHWAPWMYLSYSVIYFSMCDPKKTSKLFLILLGGLFLSFVCNSRSSILLFLVMNLTYLIYVYGSRFKLSFMKKIVISTIPILFFFGIIFYEQSIAFLISFSFMDDTSLASRGIYMGPRELIYGCYINKFQFEWIFIGVDIPGLWQECRLYFDNIDYGRSESSLMNMFSYLGFFGLLSLLYLVISSLKLSINYFFPILFLCFIFRALTGDFLIGAVHDWIFFYFLILFIKFYRDGYVLRGI